MIDHEHALPVTHQAELLQISRSSLYYAESRSLQLTSS
jgi:hypothetical protein